MLTAQIENTQKLLAALPPYDPAKEMLMDLAQRLAEALAALPEAVD